MHRITQATETLSESKCQDLSTFSSTNDMFSLQLDQRSAL